MRGAANAVIENVVIELLRRPSAAHFVVAGAWLVQPSLLADSSKELIDCLVRFAEGISRTITVATDPTNHRHAGDACH